MPFKSISHCYLKLKDLSYLSQNLGELISVAVADPVGRGGGMHSSPFEIILDPRLMLHAYIFTQVMDSMSI